MNEELIKLAQKNALLAVRVAMLEYGFGLDTIQKENIINNAKKMLGL